MALHAGEIHAIVGENGAGKTTLINILFGIYQADSGTIFVEGNPTMISSPRKAIELGIALVSQHFLLVERHTVAENLALALPSLGVRFSPARMSKRLSILNQDYGIGLELDTRVTDLSPGQKQRVEIAKALLRQSRLIVLDEPTSVLTPQEARELFQILGRLRQKGCAILFISHKLDEVLAISERISILRKGRLIETVLRQDADKIRLSRAMMGSAVSLPAKPETVVRSEARLVVEQMTLGETTAPVSFQIASGEILGIAGVAGNGQSELAQTLTGLRHAGKAQITLDGYPLQGLDAKQFHARGVALKSVVIANGSGGQISVYDLVLQRQKEMTLAASTFEPFSGPLLDAKGVMRIAAGQQLTKEGIFDTVWRVSGIVGPWPGEP